MQNFSTLLSTSYQTFRENSIAERRFSPEIVKKYIENLQEKFPHKFVVKEFGKSFEGREIYLLQIGTGKTKLLFWSQMHGDESTATAALLDIFNFFVASLSPALANYCETILQHCTLYFIPMLNPDGATKWQRRTAQQIDMNRDALALQTPEAVLLKQAQNIIKPDFGFNLHDQNIYYTAGHTSTCATISFLAPPIDNEKTVNETRQKAMQTIALLAEDLQQFIPNGVAKFSDEFEPRAFGDNMQQWGTSTILVESGAFVGDKEKQFIRKLNFILLLNAMYLIANQAYKDIPITQYYKIPNNEKLLRDVILRNVGIENTTVDIAFYCKETNKLNHIGEFVEVAEIDDIGDLSIFYAYQEVDCSKLSMQWIGEIAVGKNPTLIFRNANQKIALMVENGKIIDFSANM